MNTPAPRTSEPWQRVVVAAVAILVALGIVWPQEDWRETRTSFGTGRDGYAALQALLVRAQAGGERHFEPPARLPPGTTVWWIEPEGVCDGRIALSGRGDALDRESLRWAAGDWIEAGGHALVFLEPAGAEAPVCDAVLGFALPERRVAEGAFVRGRKLPAPRRLAFDRLRAFSEPGDWEVAATWGEEPFALTRPVGEGRVTVVADAAFLRNQHLGGADAAVLAIDWARGFGPPRLDERSHGLLPETSTFWYLVGSDALAACLGLVGLAALFAWRGAAWPPRRFSGETAEAPTLVTFVESLGALYARSRDYGRVASRYRELALARLRRHWHLPPEVRPEALAERLERAGALDPDRARALVAEVEPDSQAGLRRRLQELDRIVKEGIR
ncbi:MAG: hypothetical protein MJE66_16825 [Proteobacteria bacterium]|nr:hypothetical protein [Pseudomonadota bacterium]